MTADRVARFWAKVDKDGPVLDARPELGPCWLWRAARQAKGYGRFDTGTRLDGAHRIAWALSHGAIPDGVFVLHKCDNPPCVNPAHLFLGDAKANGADCHAKGRTTRGERNAQARLTAPEVREIRRLLRAGLSQNRVAARFGVHRGTVCDIGAGRLWAHLLDHDQEAA